MAKWLEGRVVENRHWTQTLYSLRVTGPALDFRAGQFVRIALDVGGERIARPFSFVNPPDDPLLEFYGVIVPEGPLSPSLARLQPGDPLYYADNPSGFLVLAEVPQAEELWLLATGTGLAPFLSILRTEAPWQTYRRVILVHAVRRADELVYRELIDPMRGLRGDQFRYVTFVSREEHPGSLAGRIPAAIRDGRLEAAAGAFAAERSQFMLCGNPDMVKDVTAALVERGLRKHRRRAPGQITVETFW
ncbi:MAG TPA: ferredoxin--NADP reductase [Burkholderiales bacterium]|jgi:ferredoxin--NADP+ reductase|nr:ferredoxin--NADP reductase [Burkholderiales bacterium]